MTTHLFRVFIATTTIALLGSTTACGGSNQGQSKTTSAVATSEVKAPIVAPGEAKPGDKSVCPVSKDAFTVRAESPSAEYQGKTYYFCCAGCKEEFLKDPPKYLQGDAKASTMKECAMPESR